MRMPPVLPSRTPVIGSRAPARRPTLRVWACLSFFCGLISGPFGAAQADAPAGGFRTSEPDTSGLGEDLPQKRPIRLMLLPIIFSSPDTRVAVGVLPQMVFEVSPDSRPSSIRVDAYYTQNRQFHLLLQPSFWLKENAWAASGKLSVKRWPTSYYGTGNRSQSDDTEKYTEDLTEISVEGLRRIRPGVYAALQYGLRHGRIRDVQPDGLLNSGSVPGAGRSIVSGIGAGIRLDTRDHIFYPSRGRLYQIQVTTAHPSFGSDYAFTRASVDLRQYAPVFRHHVLALQGVVRITGGSPPFRALPGIGEIFRGYSTVRFVDRNLVALQAEYRVVPVFWRLGLTVFCGVGDVFDRVEDLRLDRTKYVVGFGLRYQFSRLEKINVRVDYGFGRDSSGDYIDLTEAF